MCQPKPKHMCGLCILLGELGKYASPRLFQGAMCACMCALMYVCTCPCVYASMHIRAHTCTCVRMHVCVVCVLLRSFHALPGTLQLCRVLCVPLGRASQSAGGDCWGFLSFSRGVCTAVDRLWGSLELHTAPVGTPSPELPLKPFGYPIAYPPASRTPAATGEGSDGHPWRRPSWHPLTLSQVNEDSLASRSPEAPWAGQRMASLGTGLPLHWLPGAYGPGCAVGSPASCRARQGLGGWGRYRNKVR